MPLEDITLELVESTNVKGSIQVKGFSKTSTGERLPLVVRYTLWKGARALEVKLEGGKPGSAYPVWRTAWHNDTATLNVWQQGVKGKFMPTLQSLPDLVEIDDVEHKIYVVSSGTPVHSRFEARYLVTDCSSATCSSANSISTTVATKLAIGVDGLVR